MTETPGTLAGALAEIQAALPRVRKDKKADIPGRAYKYADLTGLSAKILPKLATVGLSFIAKPTMHDGTFVLAYSLLHTSGEREDGYYPLPASGSPQQIGSAITYARRYCLCAVTGVAPDGDDDDGQAAESAARSGQDGRSQAAPPRNRDGSISRSRASREQLDAAGIMTGEQRAEHNELRRGADGRLPKDEAAKLRRCSPGNPCAEADCPHCTPDADAWTDQPAGPPLRVPREAQSLPAQIGMHFSRLGITDRDMRLGYTAQIAGTGRLSSSNDLKASEAKRVLEVLSKCKDWAALREHLDSNQEVTAGV